MITQIFSVSGATPRESTVSEKGDRPDTADTLRRVDDESVIIKQFEQAFEVGEMLFRRRASP